jgi:outer membrane protein assembly factor BamB
MLAACQSKQSSAAMYRGGARRTGQFDTPGVPEFSEGKWKFNTGDRIWSSPVVAGGVVYFGSDDGYLYAVDIETGGEVWKFQTGDDVRSSPAIVDGVVYFGSWDNYVYALDAKTGEEIWNFYTLKNIKPVDVRRSMHDDFSSSPLVVDGVVYIGGVDGGACFFAIDAQSGEELWAKAPMLGDYVYTSPALLDDTVYFGASEGLYALDIQTGEEKWVYETDNPVQAPVIGEDGTIYIGSKYPALYAVDAKTGEVKWESKPLEPGMWTWNMSPSIALADGLVFSSISDTAEYVRRFFFAAQVDTGEVVWEFPYKSFDWSSMSVAEGVVYLGGGGSHNVHALDAQSGEELWSFETGGKVHSTPIIENGVVYVGSLDGYLYALE